MMLTLESNQSFYEHQQQVGMERATHFSWRKTAESLQKLYQEVYQNINNSQKI